MGHVDAVEDVSIDLFDEWRDEASEKKYPDLICGMRRAEAKMTPVLNTFRSQAFIQNMELAGG